MSDLTMTRGDTPTFRFTVTDTNGAVDLTPLDARFTAKRDVSHDDADAVFIKDIGTGIIIQDASGGILDVTLDADDTSAFTRDTTLYWDLQLSSAGLVYTVDSGTLEVTRDVTRTVP